MSIISYRQSLDRRGMRLLVDHMGKHTPPLSVYPLCLPLPSLPALAATAHIEARLSIHGIVRMVAPP